MIIIFSYFVFFSDVFFYYMVSSGMWFMNVLYGIYLITYFKYM